MEEVNEEGISRDVMKGFYMFLRSDALQHEQQISEIHRKQREISKKINLTQEERFQLSREAEKYLFL